MQKLPLSLISLNNICQCFLQRKKCKKCRILQKDTSGNKAHNQIYRLDSEYVICSYWKEDSDGLIPTKENIHSAYINALKKNCNIPEYIQETYNKAISVESKSGCAKHTQIEESSRAIYAAFLWAISSFEKEYKSGIFKFKTREEARKVFFKGVFKKEAPIEQGKKDTFNRYYSMAKEESYLLKNIFIESYRKGQLRSFTLDIYNMESMAWQAFILLRSSQNQRVSITPAENEGSLLKIDWEK